VLRLALAILLTHHVSGMPGDPNLGRPEVFIVEDPAATVAFRPVEEVIDRMLLRGLTNLTTQTNPRDAWLSLVRTQDVIGIKVFTEPGPNSGTRQAVVAALVKSLLAAGIPAKNLIVWDKHIIHLRLAGYGKLESRFGVRLAGSADSGYDPATFYENSILGTLVWGDFEFGRKDETVGRRSYVSKLVTQEMTRIINVTPMMNHNQAGVVGALYNLAIGSVDNTRRFEDESARLATAVPEVFALPVLADRVALNIVDALVCQYEGEERSLLHYSASLNQLRFSRDPVALDALSLQELERQRQLAKTPRLKPNMELYSNAELLELGVSDPSKIRITHLK